MLQSAERRAVMICRNDLCLRISKLKKTDCENAADCEENLKEFTRSRNNCDTNETDLQLHWLRSLATAMDMLVIESCRCGVSRLYQNGKPQLRRQMHGQRYYDDGSRISKTKTKLGNAHAMWMAAYSSWL